MIKYKIGIKNLKTNQVTYHYWPVAAIVGKRISNWEIIVSCTDSYEG